MNRYEITLANKSNIERTITVEACSQAEAITSESFAKQFHKGESIKRVIQVSGLRNYEVIMCNFKGQLSSKYVQATSPQEAANIVESDMCFGACRVVEVHEYMKGAVSRHG